MRRFIIFWVPLIALLSLFGTVLAQSGGTYTLAWFTTESGGTSSGGSFAVEGILGQSDAGQMSGGAYDITGGYLAVTAAAPNASHTPTRTATATLTRTRTKTPTGNTATFTPTRTRTNTPSVTPTTGGCTAKPEKPTLQAPANNATLTKTRPTLKWNAAACAETYTVVVKDVATGKKADKKAGLTILQYKTKALTKGKKYKWFVQACNTAFGCTKSAARTFTVQ